MNTTENFVNELSQAIISKDETAGFVAALNLLAHTVNQFERIADAAEKTASAVEAVVYYGARINVQKHD